MFSYAQNIFHFFQVGITAFWPNSRNHWEEAASTFFIPLSQVFIDGKGPPQPSLPQAAVPALSASPHMSESSCAGTDLPLSRRKRTQILWSLHRILQALGWRAPWAGHETKLYVQHKWLLLAASAAAREPEFWFARRENIYFNLNT